MKALLCLRFRRSADHPGVGLEPRFSRILKAIRLSQTVMSLNFCCALANNLHSLAGLTPD